MLPRVRLITEVRIAVENRRPDTRVRPQGYMGG